MSKDEKTRGDFKHTGGVQKGTTARKGQESGHYTGMKKVTKKGK